jgi:uncharacterized BrkB/YihY/UPF0761 family membrane protein
MFRLINQLGPEIPALTYFFIVSLAPMALGITALAVIALGDLHAAQQVAERVAHQLPAAVRGDITKLILDTKRNSPILLIVAVLSMIWACSGAMNVIERTLSNQLRRERYGLVRGKLRHFGLSVMTILLLVGVVEAATLTSGIDHQLRLGGWVTAVVATAISLLISAVLCCLLYRLAPKGGISWRAAGAGALPAALLIQVIPLGIGVYLRTLGGVATAQVFLTMATVAFACYMLAIAVLVGASLASAAELRRNGVSASSLSGSTPAAPVYDQEIELRKPETPPAAR